MTCTCCKLLPHLHCTNTKSISDTKNAKEWTCFSCASIELPLHKVRNELNTVESDANYTNEHFEKLDELKKHINICHLNIQPISSTFDEFQFMINQTNFDVITLSETWLKNDKHLLEYVRLPVYEFAYRNRDKKRGGGKGIYVRDTMKFKVYNDIWKLDESIEHLWVGIQGRKKNSACLIVVFYQVLDRKTRLRAVNSKIDVERNSHDNWRQQH